MRPSARLVFAVVMACLFLSGMAGLVYEIVWARYLSLFLGHTSYAVVAVLVAFMGGLALGNTWIGAAADRARRPLAFYAWLEVGIGLYALAFPFYYTFCHGAFISVARHLTPGATSLAALKFAFSFLAILAPTILMGGSLPLLTRVLTRSLSEVRTSVAALYCINSAGAVAGCLVGDWWFIPFWGLKTTLYGAAAMNLAAGAGALLLSSWSKEGRLPPTQGARGEGAPSGMTNGAAWTAQAARGAALREEVFSRGESKLAVLAIGLSGFVAMLYEVVWTRLLALALGASTHAFSLMLATFIAGIAVGSWIIYRWKTLRRPFNAFAWAELALAGTLFSSMFVYEYLPYWFLRLASLVVRQQEAYPFYELLQALICFVVMFIPTVCLGMTLPLVSRVATAELARAGSSVGRVFAVNTLGTVLGAGITGLWLLPRLGLARTFALGIGLNAIIGLAALARRQWRPRPGWLGLAPLLAIGWVWVAGSAFDRTWRAAFALGLYRQERPPANLAEYRALVRGTDLAYHCDGAGATVNVIRFPAPKRDEFYLKVNGKTEAGTTEDMITQLLFGHLPMLLHPAPREVLVVGLGSGVTCGAVLRHEQVRHLEAVEISPEVVAGARRWFARDNDRALENPRLRLVVEDAKTYLQISAQTYDVIISEPSNPWMAGVSGVFTREFYRSCRSRLRPDGLMAQWVQSYETSDAAFDIMLATFGAVFPHFSVWQGCLGDLLLIGSEQPLKVDLAEMERRFNQPHIKTDLERVDISRLAVLLSHQTISEANAPFVAPFDAQVHSDFYPVLEFEAQRAFFVRRDTERWNQLDENLSPRAATLLARYLQGHPLQKEDFAALKQFHFGKKFLRAALVRSWLLRWRRDEAENLDPVALSARIGDVVSSGQLESLRLAPLREVLMAHAAADPQLLRHYAVSLMAAYREQRSVFLTPNTTVLQAALERLIATDPNNQRTYRLFLAELAFDRGDDANCIPFIKAAFDPDTKQAGPLDFELEPKGPRQALARLIEVYFRLGRTEDAWRFCQEIVKQGYITITGNSPDPVLSMTFRKVLVQCPAPGR
jgi:predicted membrane-bound spermidine synthase